MVKKISEKKNTICKKCKKNITKCLKKRECEFHTIDIKKNGTIYCKDCGDNNKSFAGLRCYHKLT